MAYGNPVVGTRVGAIVRDGITRLLVNRGDSSAMADTLAKLVRDPQLRAQLGEAGRAIAETEFDLTDNVTRLIRLYGQYLDVPNVAFEVVRNVCGPIREAVIDLARPSFLWGANFLGQSLTTTFKR